MNYQKIYNAIVERRKLESPSGYFETHHIVPRSLGGSDSADNLVRLTAREHFICHLLLVKIHENTPSYYKMVKAFFMMTVISDNQQRHVSSRKYERLRKTFAESMSLSQSGEFNSQSGTMWIYSLDLKQNKKIGRDMPIPDGWNSGRIMDFDLFFDKRNQKLQPKNPKPRPLKQDVAVKTSVNNKSKIDMLREWYGIYSRVGYNQFVNQTGYKFTKPNLVQQFAKWLPEFIPQNGKTRKNNSEEADK